MRARKLDFVKTAVKEGYEIHGKSLTELAKVYQCSTGTIARCLREQDVKIRQRGRPGRKRQPIRTPEGEENGIQAMQPNTV
jgi:hypothetical protein